MRNEKLGLLQRYSTIGSEKKAIVGHLFSRSEPIGEVKLHTTTTIRIIRLTFAD